MKYKGIELTKEQVKEIKDFYENVIKKQIIKPIELNKIYSYLIPDKHPLTVRYGLKVREINMFIEYTYSKLIKELDDLFEGVKDDEEPIENTEIISEDTKQKMEESEIDDIPQTPELEQHNDNHHSEISIKVNEKKPKKKRKVTKLK